MTDPPPFTPAQAELLDALFDRLDRLVEAVIGESERHERLQAAVIEVLTRRGVLTQTDIEAADRQIGDRLLVEDLLDALTHPSAGDALFTTALRRRLRTPSSAESETP